MGFYNTARRRHTYVYPYSATYMLKIRAKTDNFKVDRLSTKNLSEDVNPRPGRGGGRYDPLPCVFFLRCTPNYESDRADILHIL